MVLIFIKSTLANTSQLLIFSIFRHKTIITFIVFLCNNKNFVRIIYHYFTAVKGKHWNPYPYMCLKISSVNIFSIIFTVNLSYIFIDNCIKIIKTIQMMREYCFVLPYYYLILILDVSVFWNGLVF